MTANSLHTNADELVTVEGPSETHPVSQGSVTYPQAEEIALSASRTRSVEDIAQVLTSLGLSLR